MKKVVLIIIVTLFVSGCAELSDWEVRIADGYHLSRLSNYHIILETCYESEKIDFDRYTIRAVKYNKNYIFLQMIKYSEILYFERENPGLDAVKEIISSPSKELLYYTIINVNTHEVADLFTEDEFYAHIANNYYGNMTDWNMTKGGLGLENDYELEC